MGIKQLKSRPRDPQTCGKLERYYRAFKNFYADEGWVISWFLRGVTVLMIMLSCIDAAREHQPCGMLSGEFSPVSDREPTG
jgi:hypothetical protein